MKSIEDFEQDLRIDRQVLDDQIEEHPTLVWQVGDALSQAISRRDLAKKEYEEEMAAADAEIRKLAVAAKDKITETQVASRVKLDPGVDDAYVKYLDAKAEAARWADLKTAFEARGYALRELVELYVNDYWAPGVGSAKSK